MKVRVTDAPFELEQAIKELAAPEVGAYVSFLGRVRNESHGKRVKALVYEVYEDMAVAEMERIRREALERFPIHDVLIWHRWGELGVGEDTMLVLVTAGHRREAFEACAWVVDEVKKRVPVWKKEVTDDGVFWVEGNRHVSTE